ncbi:MULTISPECIES: HNH endonuclease [Bacillaceae]|uniref:HNH endonuclease n=1 Tax=Gracilibacillus salinarum TaxID=2932255 RepID=A0ABY4GKE7_9BACI|nr:MULTISPECIES: HNH endonuclease signature motif containing protein [Bacillaceae]UOQ84645.1 HNH endonuclease [Gracilibacillus salinarum]
MDKRSTKIKWHGNEAINMASHVIAELYGLNDLTIENWIFYADVDFLSICAKPRKKTILHEYIEYIYFTNYDYMLDKHFPMEVINTLTGLLDFYNIDYTILGKFDNVGKTDDELNPEEFEEAEDYARELFDFFMDELSPVIIDDIFTVLYSNKLFLFEFNSQLRELILNLKAEDIPEYLKKDGVIKRCKYIPQWLKRGVFMRDKGRCQICGADLTKILNLDNTENYDHIIPLENRGNNDPINFQLTCEHCNKSKGDRSMAFNSLSNRYWDID